MRRAHSAELTAAVKAITLSRLVILVSPSC
jgi:hypothetical protein